MVKIMGANKREDESNLFKPLEGCSYKYKYTVSTKIRVVDALLSPAESKSKRREKRVRRGL